MKTYKLLTPGPLTTTDSVKQEMLFDHCTWDEDYKQITQRIRRELLQLAHVDETAYTTVLMQGSGTFGVESVISSVIPDDGCLLLLGNGAYGERIAAMCRYQHINCVHIVQDYDKMPDRMKAEEALKQHPEITHIAMIHSETTTGILNDIQSIGELAKTYQKVFIVDAMSSFAGVDIPMHDWHRKKRAFDRFQRLCPQSVLGPVRSVGRHGEGWKMALYLSYACCSGICQGNGGAAKGRRYSCKK